MADEAKEERKPSISVSKIKMYFRCGEMYRRRVIDKEPLIPTVPLHKGTSVHYGAEVNFLQKIETFKDLSQSKVKEAAAEAFDTRIKNEGVMLTAEEEKIGLQKVLGSAKDRAMALTGLYCDYVAPAHQPVMVEKFQRISLKEDLDLVVKLDMVNTRTEIVDYKTGKRSLNQSAVDEDIQYTIYALAQKALNKEANAPDATSSTSIIENLVDTGKSLKHNRIETIRTKADFQKAIDNINLFLTGLTAGVFLPAPKSEWYCSESSCGYARTCKYFKFYQKGGDLPKPSWFGKKRSFTKKKSTKGSK